MLTTARMQCYLNVVYFLISGNSLLSGGACQPPAPPKYLEASRAVGVQSRPLATYDDSYRLFKTNLTLLLHFRPQTEWTGPFHRANPLGPGMVQVHVSPCQETRHPRERRISSPQHVPTSRAARLHISHLSVAVSLHSLPLSHPPPLATRCIHI
jgi:hypothetical protein